MLLAMQKELLEVKKILRLQFLLDLLSVINLQAPGKLKTMS